MAETVARRGGITVLTQYIPLDVVETVVNYVKSRHTVWDTPITLEPERTVGEALSLIHKRAHGAVMVVDANGEPEGIFTEHDAVGYDRFTDRHLQAAPVVDERGRLIGAATRTGALRSTIYRPAVDAAGRLRTAV